MASQGKDHMPLWHLLYFPLGLLLPGCASHEAVPPAVASPTTTEQRVSDLEQRIEKLESRPPVLAPAGNREDIQARIRQLEAERSNLLLRYTELHPAVRNVNRKLLILQEQLRMLEP
jgi:hypothetical protein